MDKIIKLNKLYKDDQLILFAGAGVSANSNFPTWKEFTHRLIELMNLQEKYQYTDQDGEVQWKYLAFSDYIKIAQFYFNKVKRRDYYNLISTTFDVERKSHELHDLIVEMAQSDIFTTNYDNLIEKSSVPFVKNYSLIKYGDDLISAHHHRKIVKLHGDSQDPKTIVLKEDDYLNFKKNKGIIHDYTKSQFYSKVVLFIGYSLDDYNIRELLNDVNFSKSDSPRYSFLLSDNSDNDLEWKNNVKLLKERFVEVIDVKKFSEEYNQEHSDKRGDWYCFYLKAIMNPSLIKGGIGYSQKLFEEQIKLMLLQKYICPSDLENLVNQKFITTYTTSNELCVFNHDVFSIISENVSEEKGSWRELFKKSSFNIITNKGRDKHFSVDNFSDETITKQIVASIESHAFIVNTVHREFDEAKISRALSILIEHNDYSTIVNTINKIILEHKGPSYLKNGEIFTPLEDKINLFSKGLNYETRNAYNHLFSIGSFNFSKHIKLALSINKTVKSEIARASGSFSSNIDYFAKTTKIIDDIFTYPIINGLLIDTYVGDYYSISNIISETLLMPYSNNYINKSVGVDIYTPSNNAFSCVLTSRQAIFICYLTKNKDLLSILKLNSIKEIKSEITYTEIHNLIKSYLKLLEAGNDYGLNKFQNMYINNLILIATRLADFNFQELFDLLLYSTNGEYISFYLKNLCKRDNHYYKSMHISSKSFNKLLTLILSDKNAPTEITNFEILIQENISKVSKTNEKEIIHLIQETKLSDSVPFWVLLFKGLKSFPRDTIKKNINDYSHDQIVLLYLFDIITNEDDFIYILKKKKKNCTKHKMMTYIAHGDYYFQQIYRKINNTGLLWEYYTLDKYDENYEYSLIEGFVNSFIPLEFKRSPTFMEAELLKRFIDEGYVNDSTRLDLIKKELIKLETMGIINSACYYLLGAL